MSNFEETMSKALKDVPIYVEQDESTEPIETLFERLFGTKCKWCQHKRLVFLKSLCKNCFFKYNQNTLVSLERRIEKLEKIKQ